MQSSFWRENMKVKFLEHIQRIPDSENLIWSWSANAHGPLSFVTLWAANKDSVNVFPINFFLGKTMELTITTINSTLQWIQNELDLKIAFFLHDRESFDRRLPMALPILHTATTLTQYFMKSSLSVYVLGDGNNVVWMGRVFTAALAQASPTLYQAILDYPKLSTDRLAGDSLTYRLNLGLFDGPTLASVLKRVLELLPGDDPRNSTSWRGLTVTLPNGESRPINGMKQSIVDMFTLFRFLFNRKPQHQASEFARGDFRAICTTLLLEVILKRCVYLSVS